MLNQPRLADELASLEIWDLDIADKCQEVAPVEFKAGRCTAPLTYPLYGEGEASKYDEGGFGYNVEVDILAGIADKRGAGGGDISIQDIWWRIESIDDPQPGETSLQPDLFRFDRAIGSDTRRCRKRRYSDDAGDFILEAARMLSNE